jgi:hypothetical protein
VESLFGFLRSIKHYDSSKEGVLPLKLDALPPCDASSPMSRVDWAWSFFSLVVLSNRYFQAWIRIGSSFSDDASAFADVAPILSIRHLLVVYGSDGSGHDVHRQQALPDWPSSWSIFVL